MNAALAEPRRTVRKTELLTCFLRMGLTSFDGVQPPPHGWVVYAITASVTALDWYGLV